MDEEYKSFVTALRNIRKEYVPTKQVRANNSNPKWMDNTVENLNGIKKWYLWKAEGSHTLAHPHCGYYAFILHQPK